MSAAHKLSTAPRRVPEWANTFLGDLDHQSNVSCVAVGRRSGRVLAVASPKSIAVWVLGKQAATEVRAPTGPYWSLIGGAELH